MPRLRHREPVLDEGVVAAARESILRDVDLINALRGYAMGVEPLPLKRLSHLEGPVLEYLESEPGREDVQRWVAAFVKSIALIQEFRDYMVHARSRPSDEDIVDAARGSSDVIGALFKTLGQRASSNATVTAGVSSPTTARRRRSKAD